MLMIRNSSLLILPEFIFQGEAIDRPPVLLYQLTGGTVKVLRIVSILMARPSWSDVPFLMIIGMKMIGQIICQKIS